MTITLNDIRYNVITNRNITARDTISNLPLNLTLSRYADHEYNAELPFVPQNAKESTSSIKAGHIYYWNGWNSFVLNFENMNISPYKVVEIGKIDSEVIADILRKSGSRIHISAE